MGNSFVQNDATQHPVRCCSENYIWPHEGKGMKKCNDVYGMSEIGPVKLRWTDWQVTSYRECANARTFSEAGDVCAKYGARLCTKNEVERGCVAQTGCGFDEQYIWSSTHP